jgi:hypothetical protein
MTQRLEKPLTLSGLRATDHVMIARPGDDEDYYVTVENMYTAAAEGQEGVVAIATAAETYTGTDDSLAVSPKGYKTAFSSDFTLNFGTAFTAKALNLNPISFAGGNTTNATCDAVGVVPGDKIIGVAGITQAGAYDAWFQSTVTVTSQIKQIVGTNATASMFLAFTYRP